MKLLLPIISLVLLTSQSILAQTQSPFSTTQLNRLDSIAIQDVPAGAPGMATAIVLDGKIVFEKYAGYADFGDSSLITKETRFNIASNGKQFTALAILTLLDDNKLELTDDIRTFLPSLFPNVKADITIKNLLSHTSGIRDVYDLWSLQDITWWKKSFDNGDVLELIEKQQQLNFVPNTSYLYSNTNYILLALIIEKVSGKSFISFTNDLFEQLNMPDTSFENDYSKIQGPIARAYFNFDTWTTYTWIWNVVGDGNIFSTLTDQIQWEKVVQGKGVTSIKKEIISESQQLIENSTIPNYGYGLEFGNYKGLEYKFHEGATGAWKATVIRFPSENISLITLTNTGKSIPSMQTRQMADVVLRVKENAKYLVTKPEKIGEYVSEDQIVGTFLTENDFTFQFEMKDGKLYLKRNGRNDIELEREADNIFHQKFDPLFKQEFKTNLKGEMEVTAYYTTHAPYTLTRADSNWEGFNFEALSGQYLNTETNTLIEINFAGDKNYDVKIGAKSSTKGLIITSTKLLVGEYTINIENNPEGIGTLFLNGDRIRRVKFERAK